MAGKHSIIIDRRFRGPTPDRGHGGYFAGLIWTLAPHIRGVRIVSRQGIPLDTPLAVDVAAEGMPVTVGTRDGRVAESATPGANVSFLTPEAVTLDEAVQAGKRFAGFSRHGDLRQCFACGPDRTDGLRIFAGPVAGRLVEGRPLLAAVWVPDARFGCANGEVRSEFVWAALDCPGGWAISGSVETGTIWADVREPIRVEQRVIVTGWQLEAPDPRPGSRSRHAGSAIFSEAGDLLAVSRATWVVPRDGGSA